MFLLGALKTAAFVAILNVVLLLSHGLSDMAWLNPHEGVQPSERFTGLVHPHQAGVDKAPAGFGLPTQVTLLDGNGGRWKVHADSTRFAGVIGAARAIIDGQTSYRYPRRLTDKELDRLRLTDRYPGAEVAFAEDLSMGTRQRGGFVDRTDRWEYRIASGDKLLILPFKKGPNGGFYFLLHHKAGPQWLPPTWSEGWWEFFESRTPPAAVLRWARGGSSA